MRAAAAAAAAMTVAGAGDRKLPEPSGAAASAGQPRMKGRRGAFSDRICMAGLTAQSLHLSAGRGVEKL